MVRPLVFALIVHSLLVPAGAVLAQDDARDDDDEDAEEGASKHPTAGRLTFAGRLGWTSRMGSTPSVDPLEIYPVEDDPLDPMGPITPFDFEAELRRDDRPLPDTNPFGLRIGGRVGYTLEDLLYFGAAAHYYLGDEETSIIPSGETSSTRVNILTAGLELGVDAAVSEALVIRPFMGFGAAIGLAEVCISDECASGSQLQGYLNPGLGLIGFVTDGIFVGGEAALFGMSGPGRLSGFDAVLTAGASL